MSLPDALKSLKPFMLRAMEMEKLDPMVAYHCKLYVMEKSLAKMQTTAKTSPEYAGVKNFVLSQMTELESAKTGLDLSKAKDHMETFCTAIFMKVDKEDRKEEVTKRTAMSFSSCAQFIETMSVFGEMEPDWEEKRKYCKWKAVDIARAFKEGRVPKRGGPNEEVPDPEEDMINQLDALTPSDHLGGGSSSNNDGDLPSVPGGGDFGRKQSGPAGNVPDDLSDLISSGVLNTPGSGNDASSNLGGGDSAANTTSTTNITPGGYSPFGNEETKKSETLSKPVAKSTPTPSSSTTSTSSSLGSGQVGQKLSGGGNYNPTYKERTEASKMCSYAVSELQFNNIEQAKTNVLKAWNLLNGIKD